MFRNPEDVSIPNKDLLSWIFDDQKYDADKPIFIDATTPSNSISSRKARHIIRQLVQGLRIAGLERGDCVCVHSFNDIHYPLLFLGIIAAGGIFAGTNPSYTPAELSHHFKVTNSRFLITEPEMLPNIVVAARACDIPTTHVWVFDVLGQAIPTGFQSWTTLLEYGEADWERFENMKLAQETTIARLVSSGTTGLPKAANFSHYNFIAQHTIASDVNRKPYHIKRLVPLPMFHIVTATTTHVASLREGEETWILRRLHIPTFLTVIEKHGITDIPVGPSIALSLLRDPLLTADMFSSVQAAFSGGSPLSKEIQNAFYERFLPGKKFTQMWGMTETCNAVTHFAFPEHDRTGSVGRIVSNLDIKLIDDDGNDISDYNVQGEICVRGPTLFQGYFNNADATSAAFDKDMYLKTGDIGYCDERTKKWYIVARKKEFMKIRGFQVAPTEIENVLLSHPLVAEVAVIGVTNKSSDEELPRAYVVLVGETDASVTEEFLVEFAAKRLARYKRLTGGVRFVKELPKTAVGKIQKRTLIEQAKAEIRLGEGKL